MEMLFLFRIPVSFSREQHCEVYRWSPFSIAMAIPLRADFSIQSLGDVSNYRRLRVDGFGTESHEDWIPLNVLSDWPPIWASLESLVRFDEVIPIEMRLHTAMFDAETDTNAIGKKPLAIAHGSLWERIFLYGPLTRESLHILRDFGNDVWGAIYDFQIEIAMDLLLPCTLALKSLTPELRRRIYGYAFSRRASDTEPNQTQSLEDSFQILVRATNGPNQFQVTPPTADWHMVVPTHATINDVKRKIRSELWRQNASRPPEERLDEDDMEALSLWFGHPCPNNGYIQGASFFKYLVDTMSMEENVPRIYVFMGCD